MRLELKNTKDLIKGPSYGSPDKAIEVDQRNFKEYEYTVEDLPEFTAFVVKIVGQGNNTCVVPAVSALRCMALA